MDISPLQSHVKASTVPFDQLAANPNVSQSDKVKEACRQFEAILLRQILGEARKTVITSSANGDSNETGIYNDMINNPTASVAAELSDWPRVWRTNWSARFCPKARNRGNPAPQPRRPRTNRLLNRD
jgi:hypothetical protein